MENNKGIRVKRTLVMLCGLFFVAVWIFVAQRSGLRLVFTAKDQPRIPPVIIYKNCSKIPRAPKGGLWPEEHYLHERPFVDIRELANPKYSIVRLEGKSDIETGDSIHVTVILFDGYNRRKKTGRDLVRVWIREPSLNASANGKVIDNRDGTYTAILTAFWEGKPEVVAAIISPLEVTAFSMKRRYLLPNILMNTAVFVHPEDSFISEETPCNYDPQIPGYDVICNFTEDNFGIPWYCGKPRTFRLSCSDWSMVGAKNLWQLGIEQNHLSPSELDLLSLERKAMVLKNKISLLVRPAFHRQNGQPLPNCNSTSPSETWGRGSPTGYLYNRKWYSKYCQRGQQMNSDLKQCLKNTNIVTIGDSTIRQLFLAFEKLLPCTWVTETWSKHEKHRPVTCINKDWNFNLTYALHQLPFCSQNTPRHYFKPFRAYANGVKARQRTVMVVNLFSHFLNLHSHVYFEALLRLQKEILALLNRNPNVTVVIKGPHAYSFARNTDSVLWMPDIYADIYQDYLYEVFKGLSERVIYLNAFDITVSSEQWHIHSEDYLIDELVMNLLGYIC